MNAPTALPATRLSKVSRRMRSTFRALLAGGLGFAVAVLVAACGGSSGVLSADQAATLNSQLSAVASAINSQSCSKAGEAAQSFDNAVANLPSSVSSKFTSYLKKASGQLAEQAEPYCEDQTTSIPTTTKTTPTTATKTTPTDTTGTTTSTTGTGTGPATTTSPATTTTSTGTTSTGQSGGAGLGGTGTSTGTGTGDGGSAPNGNGN
jgi:hypothetical protein